VQSTCTQKGYAVPKSWERIRVVFGFWFLVCYTATQLATQLRQRCIQVLCSNKEAQKRLTESNGTPAMDLGHENVVLKKYYFHVLFYDCCFEVDIRIRKYTQTMSRTKWCSNKVTRFICFRSHSEPNRIWGTFYVTRPWLKPASFRFIWRILYLSRSAGVVAASWRGYKTIIKCRRLSST